MIPGSNVLSIALSVMGHTSVLYYKFLANTVNSGGYDVATYLPAVTITSGSVQSVNRAKYNELGLDLEKRYIQWFVPGVDVIDIARGYSGDIIEVLGRRWQLTGGDDWYLIDGWKAIMAVDIGPATGATTNA